MVFFIRDAAGKPRAADGEDRPINNKVSNDAFREWVFREGPAGLFTGQPVNHVLKDVGTIFLTHGAADMTLQP